MNRGKYLLFSIPFSAFLFPYLVVKAGGWAFPLAWVFFFFTALPFLATAGFSKWANSSGNSKMLSVLEEAVRVTHLSALLLLGVEATKTFNWVTGKDVWWMVVGMLGAFFLSEFAPVRSIFDGIALALVIVALGFGVAGATTLTSEAIDKVFRLESVRSPLVLVLPGAILGAVGCGGWFEERVRRSPKFFWRDSDAYFLYGTVFLSLVLFAFSFTEIHFTVFSGKGVSAYAPLYGIFNLLIALASFLTIFFSSLSFREKLFAVSAGLGFYFVGDLSDYDGLILSFLISYWFIGFLRHYAVLYSCNRGKLANYWGISSKIRTSIVGSFLVFGPLASALLLGVILL